MNLSFVETIDLERPQKYLALVSLLYIISILFIENSCVLQPMEKSYIPFTNTTYNMLKNITKHITRGGTPESSVWGDFKTQSCKGEPCGYVCVAKRNIYVHIYQLFCHFLYHGK